MSKGIQITGSVLQGNFAIGAGARAITKGTQSIGGNAGISPFDRLSQALSQHGVTPEQLAELRTALDADETVRELDPKRPGPSTREWMKKMLGRAVDATWQIELGIASGLLTTSLQQYYGG